MRVDAMDCFASLAMTGESGASARRLPPAACPYLTISQKIPASQMNANVNSTVRR